MTRSSPDTRFAIIGAGAGGLCMAKYLKQAGFRNIIIFEIGTAIGGVWRFRNDNGRSAAYRTLHINTPKKLTNFSDFPFKDDVQLFPDHEDMYNYLVDFAAHHDLTRLIRFKSKVVNVHPAPDYTAEQPRWAVKVEGQAEELFDRVIVATGHLSEPVHVPEFRDNFGGEYLHSHSYKEPEEFAGKRICVVGIGNSAIDIASDVCVNSKRTVLVARSGVVILPKLIFGRPFIDMTSRLNRVPMPAFLRRKIVNGMIYLVHGKMTDLGFPPATVRVHTTSSAVLVSHIAYQRVIVKNGIKSLAGRQITFTDGSSEEFDVLIGATGYRIDLPFLAPEILSVKDNQLDLYKRIIAPGWNGLYFFGFINITTALNLAFEYQARWITAIETGNVTLPAAEKMHEAVRRKRDWMRQTFKQTLRHTLEEEHLTYFAELRVPKDQARYPDKLPV